MLAWLHSGALASDDLQIARGLTQAIQVPKRDQVILQTKLAQNKSSDSVLIAPTGAGKSAHAVAFAEDVLLSGRAVLCIAPYHTLIDELFQRMQHAFQARGFVCGRLSEMTPPQACRADVCLGTPEQALKLLLLHASKLKFGGIIVDEVHHVLEPGSRSERLQALLMLVRRARAQACAGSPRVRLLGLSATVQPRAAFQFAQWLPCSLVYRLQRSVPLHVSKLVGGIVTPLLPRPVLPAAAEASHKHLQEPHDEPIQHDGSSGALSYVVLRVKQGARVVFFVPSRAACQQLAKLLASKLPAGAISYHHAGLSQSERTSSLQGFQEGRVRALVATTTLAMGVNLPASDVIILSSTFRGRQPSGQSHREWSLLQQQAGRAGRWGLQSHGRCLLTAAGATIAPLAFAHPLGATPPTVSEARAEADEVRHWQAAEAILLTAFCRLLPLSCGDCHAAVQGGLAFATASPRECAAHLVRALCILRACDFIDMHHDARHTGAAAHLHVRFTLTKGGAAAAEALPVCPLQEFVRVVQFACASSPPQVLPLDADSPQRRLSMLLGTASSGHASSDTAFALAPLRQMGRSFDWKILRTWLAINPKSINS